jgi:hypothetical protein
MQRRFNAIETPIQYTFQSRTAASPYGEFSRPVYGTSVAFYGTSRLFTKRLFPSNGRERTLRYLQRLSWRQKSTSSLMNTIADSITAGRPFWKPQ